MSSHANLSPSKRHRWMLCPGSIREEAKYPDERNNAAVDGTHTHTLLEYIIKTGVQMKELLIGMKLSDHDGEFTITQERLDRVQVALDYVAQRVLTGDFHSVISEKKVSLERIFKRNDLNGTVDIQLIGPKHIELIDYKDGMSPVEAENNPQLEQYGFGVIAEHLDENLKCPFEFITMTVIQPKLSLKGMSPIASVTLPIMEFLMKESQLRREAEATDDPNAPLIPGDKQCKYCKHNGACVPLNNKVVESLGFEAIDIAVQAANKNPTDMSNEQLAEFMEGVPLLRQLIEGVENEVQRRLNAGIKVNGFKLVRSRGSRAWALNDEQIAERLKKFGLPLDSIWQKSLISPAQVEKVKWKKRDGTEVQLSERQLAMLQKEYITKKDGKLAVAPESDSRPSVDLIPDDLFKPSWLGEN